jgi:hypothetical protein
MTNENMDTENDPTISGHLLLFRGKDWDEGLSAEQLEEAMARVIAWFEGINNSGKVKGGQPLARKGKTISGKSGRIVADGPFAESKEAIGGYLYLNVDDFDEAVAIAKSCPTLEYGISIEVRPVLEECPIFRRASQRYSFAGAAS